MPARKPGSLSTRHSTKEEKTARSAAESAMRPSTPLTARPPAALKGHKAASALWKNLIALNDETEEPLMTAWDADLLVKYCLAEEELDELFKLRNEIKKLWVTHSKWLGKLNPKADQLKDYFNALGQANALLQRFQGMDARMDGKRKMLLAMAQSLYLTPRSRAGVAPAEKEPQEPDDPMSKLLDE